MVFLISFHHLLGKTWRADIISASNAKYISFTFSENTNDKALQRQIKRKSKIFPKATGEGTLEKLENILIVLNTSSISRLANISQNIRKYFYGNE